MPEPGAGMVCGLKLTIVPDGMPNADRLMAPLKPPAIVEVMVELPWFPCSTISEAGEADKVKLGAAETVSVTVTVRCRPPPLPLMVMG